MNQLIKQSNQTPIEVLLAVDEEGRTSARKVYSFLELAKGQFSRWVKTNILENPFAIEGEDFDRFDIYVEGNHTFDYKLTASFAKKLCMLSKTERGEQARNYFIKVEDKLKEVVKESNQVKPTSLGDVVKLIRATRESMEKQGHDEHEIALAIEEICNQFGIKLPEFFVKPKEITMNDVESMIDFIYSRPRGKGHKLTTYDDFIVQMSVKKLN